MSINDVCVPKAKGKQWIACKYDKCRTRFYTVEEMDKHIEKMDKKSDKQFRWFLKNNPSASLKREDFNHAHGYMTYIGYGADKARAYYVSLGFTKGESPDTNDMEQLPNGDWRYKV